MLIAIIWIIGFFITAIAITKKFSFGKDVETQGFESFLITILSAIWPMTWFLYTSFLINNKITKRKTEQS